MQKKIMTGLVALAGAATRTAGGAAACDVRHGPWYESNSWNKVDVYNECSGGKYVRVNIPGRSDHGPVYVAGRTAKTITHGWAWSVPTGRSLYYATSSGGC
ncbi:hypothetical protein ACFYY8_28020 [Streptosporangium sp. NPDC001559]|uniref:hypothetical protein n=1 Tax=Streptosporangium sp. NPDC001559 TaxID=3366187 RepID=UPI0036E84999